MIPRCKNVVICGVYEFNYKHLNCSRWINFKSGRRVFITLINVNNESGAND